MANAYEKKQKAIYDTLQPVFCPALQETVYFNADGFHHLMFDDRRPRGPAERHYRLNLLPYVQDVISNATQAVPNVKSQNPPVVTWSLNHAMVKAKTNGLPCDVKVIVIRKKPAGKLYFLSTMCKGQCKEKKKRFGLF